MFFWPRNTFEQVMYPLNKDWGLAAINEARNIFPCEPWTSIGHRQGLTSHQLRMFIVANNVGVTFPRLAQVLREMPIPHSYEKTQETEKTTEWLRKRIKEEILAIPERV